MTKKPPTGLLRLEILIKKIKLAFDPLSDKLRTQPGQIKLILLLVAVEVIGKFSRFLNLFKLVDGGIAQGLYRRHPFGRNSDGLVFLGLAQGRGLGLGFGFHLRET